MNEITVNIANLFQVGLFAAVGVIWKNFGWRFSRIEEKVNKLEDRQERLLRIIDVKIDDLKSLLSKLELNITRNHPTKEEIKETLCYMAKIGREDEKHD